MIRKTPLRRKANKPKRKKKSNRKRLIKALDTVFSQFIRLRDSDPDGLCACVTCGTKKHWKRQQAGHYVSRGNYATRWDEQNVHAQCYACNVPQHGNMAEYTLFLQRTYGHDIIETLVITGKRVRKFTDEELEGLVAHYRAEVERLMR